MASDGVGSSSVAPGRGNSIVQTLSRTFSRRTEEQDERYVEREADRPISKAEGM